MLLRYIFIFSIKLKCIFVILSEVIVSIIQDLPCLPLYSLQEIKFVDLQYSRGSLGKSNLEPKKLFDQFCGS